MGGGGTNRLRVLARRALEVNGAEVRRVAAARREGFEESGRTSLALRLSLGGASHLRVLARWTLGVGSAGLSDEPRPRAFEESGRTRPTYNISGFRAVCCVCPRRTLGLGFTMVGNVAAARRNGFVESVRTRLALGLGRGRTGLLRVLARRALGVGGTSI